MAAREKDGYAAFLRVRDEDPRYRSLVVRDEGGVALDERRYHGSRQTSANAELGALLARWDAEAVVHQLIASPKIEQELLGALVDACADHDLATDAPAAGVRYSAFLNALGATEARRTESIASRMPRTALPVARSSPMALARFRFLADVEAGISPDRWALSPRGDAFDLPISRAALTNVFLDQAAERDPAVREELSAAEANGDCAAIRTRQTLARGEGL